MNNKVKVCFLVFDDDSNQETIIKTKIVDRLKEYDVTYWLVDPSEFVDLDTSTFKKQEFLDHVFEKTKGFGISVVASDCNLIKIDDFKVQGIDIVSILLSEKRKPYNAPFILYSGKIEESSKHLLEKIQTQVAENMKSGQYDINSIEILKHLMSARIVFSGRTEDSYTDAIIKIIKSEVDVKDILVSSFQKFGKTTLKTGNSIYDGKTLDAIVQLIEANDMNSQRFIQEFTELAIAHYTEIN
ncbi:hypothetical protein [Pedobacter sp. R20-19]|uniref:hypothetical protein n=1 Tax=Pedobacter sp. R20-19 TaxID=1270196 RepID=UPI00049310A3|nr:hypothetical protein [Pedobacter sp. R20-19]